MALAETLPIYQPAWILLGLVMDLTKQYPRAYRQVLARKVADEAQEVVVGIISANCATDKTPHLEELRIHLEKLKVLLRLSKDRRLISVGHFGATVELTTAIGKQLTGWLNHAKRKAPDV